MRAYGAAICIGRDSSKRAACLHNASFELSFERRLILLKHGFPIVPTEHEFRLRVVC
eukprot:COSAG05_NODE_611_length_8359_cov_5.328935_7_plen_57_part_00